MCIIVVKEKGQEIPSDDILKNCFKNNSDGAGYMFCDMYRKKPSVIIRKGFMKINSFLDDLHNRSFTKDDVVVMHFRIGTSGAMDGTCTHPFPLTDSVEKLVKTRVVCKAGVVHNGVFGFGEKELSDTIIFIRDTLTNPLVKKFINTSYAVRTLVNESIGTSRLCMLDNMGNLQYFGDTWTIDDGITYSNSSYKKTATTHISKGAHNNYSNNNPSYDHYNDHNDNFTYNYIYYKKCTKCNTSKCVVFTGYSFKTPVICCDCGIVL